MFIEYELNCDLRNIPIFFVGDKDILMMGNHGVLSVAPSVSQAYDLLYYLERAAQLQVRLQPFHSAL